MLLYAQPVTTNKQEAIKHFRHVIDTHDLFWVQRALLNMEGGQYFEANKYKSLPGVQLFMTVQEIVDASQYAQAYLKYTFRHFEIKWDKILQDHRTSRPDDHPYNLMLPIAQECSLVDAGHDDEWDSDDSGGVSDGSAKVSTGVQLFHDHF
jgi:hypothetical protein